MIKRQILIGIMLSTFLLFGCINKSRKVENIRSFAKVYGYVRWFYPSDEAAKLDLEKFAVYGVSKVEKAHNTNELKKILLELFVPITPVIQFLDSDKGLNFDTHSLIPIDTIGFKPVAWKHFGVYLSEANKVYKSERITLSEGMPKVGEVINKDIGSGLRLVMPMVLYRNKEHTFPLSDSKLLNDLKENLDRISLNQSDPNDVSIRLANVIIVWNVIQHFYPYFDVVKIDWGNELTSIIQNTLSAKTEIEYFNVLRLFIAKLEDGHAAVLKKLVSFGLPLKYDLVENEIVVTFSQSEDFKKGDIIKNIDGKSGLEELEKQMSYVSGSPRYKRYMALVSFGMDFNRNEAILSVIRNGKEITIKTKRRTFDEMSINPFPTESFKIIDCGDSIVYLKGEPIDINSNLNKLVNAKSMIINSRTDDSQQKLISHFIKEPIFGPRCYLPIFTYPDREKMYFDYEGSMTIYPQEPHFNADLIYLTYPDNLSHEETYLDFIDHYKLAKLVGDTTAGCNGSRNTIPLIGGYYITFTGEKVIKRDSSQLYLIGYRPDYPVNRTIKGIIENRDEYLDKALEVLKK